MNILWMLQMGIYEYIVDVVNDNIYGYIVDVVDGNDYERDENEPPQGQQRASESQVLNSCLYYNEI